ncbi:MAG: formylglycine-generating enzyme family protein, partial [Victivallales bacterium]|nr:formylglycine-generating enzyme family protein [Victivallales bacterium]
EYKLGTNPVKMDTDGDEMSDGWEVKNNRNPLDPNDIDSETLTARYIVVDLSGGPDAVNYPVRYSTTGPDLNDDTCRTAELWLRRIPKGTFIMGSPEDELGHYSDETQHEVTLTQDYYIGVFECTQKQWELVMGDNPAKYKGECRPVEFFSYNTIRGTGDHYTDGGAGWPSYGHAVAPSSFMGILQAKTGLTFDLPTEAQWEYACRAGTTTALNSGKNLTDGDEDAAMDEFGRYTYNKSDGKGGYSEHTKVGSYLPNAWGLYDMHGNVWEWCLDWYELYGTDAVSDPVGPTSRSYRVIRGGGWRSVANYCRSAIRKNYSYPTIGQGLIDFGFRIACLPQQDLYAVVDLSGGPDAESYPVRYSAIGPDLNDDTCRTTELWLRKISAGTFTMGSPEDEVGRNSDETQHEVTLTQDYYIGVFECTQKQWELVMKKNPSVSKGPSCPVDKVSYDMIRGTGSQAGAGWPTYGYTVDATSFMGKLRAKTGLVFDLPTEAQWEYACRAGTKTALNSGKNVIDSIKDAAMNEVGRYNGNASDGKGGYSLFTKVGSYLPNAWGLYDMHGNLYEWCLDWFGSYEAEAVEDPLGVTMGTSRVKRGGGYYTVSTGGQGVYFCLTYECRSAARNSSDSKHKGYVGFRIVCLP